VVVDGGAGRFGVEVERLRGQHEAVVKPFDSAAGTLPLFAGATLLSDGRPSLILDVPRLSAWTAEAAPDSSLSTTTNETRC
jgi:chemotaxis protein histidine kinase CheA